MCQVSLSLGLSLGLGGYYSIRSWSCFMWSGTLDSSGFVLSNSIIPLASHLSIILISKLFSMSKHIYLPTYAPLPAVPASAKVGHGTEWVASC